MRSETQMEPKKDFTIDDTLDVRYFLKILRQLTSRSTLQSKWLRPSDRSDVE